MQRRQSILVLSRVDRRDDQLPGKPHVPPDIHGDENTAWSRHPAVYLREKCHGLTAIDVHENGRLYGVAGGTRSGFLMVPSARG